MMASTALILLVNLSMFSSSISFESKGSFKLPTGIQGAICSLAESSVCADKFFSLLRSTSDSRYEFREVLHQVGNHSEVGKVVRRSDNCKSATSVGDFQGGKFLKNMFDGMIYEDISFDIKEMQSILSCSKDSLSRLGRSKRNNPKFKNTICWPLWRGDGYCDLGCNTEEYNYDDGDCCYETCISKVRRYPCGFTGFQCKEKASGTPDWSKDLKLCFKWKPSGDGRQCDRSGRGKVCAPFGSMTRYYYDDTDEREGGCALSWSIQARSAPSWFWSRLRLCFYAYSDGHSHQCNYGRIGMVQCKSANRWLHYVDNTDDRHGGCFLRWKLIYLGTRRFHFYHCSNCYRHFLVVFNEFWLFNSQNIEP